MYPRTVTMRKNSYANSGACGPSALTICGTYLNGVNANREAPDAILYPK